MIYAAIIFPSTDDRSRLEAALFGLAFLCSGYSEFIWIFTCFCNAVTNICTTMFWYTASGKYLMNSMLMPSISVTACLISVGKKDTVTSVVYMFNVNVGFL